MLAVSISDPPQGFTDDDPRSDHSSDRVHDRQRGERLHEHQHRRLLGHPVHLPRRVQHRQAAEPGAVGRARGRRADAAGDRSRRGLQLGDEPGPVHVQPGGTGYSDPKVFDTCVGGSEGPGQTGEGPCDPTRASARTRRPKGPNGPVACPTNDPTSGANCEFADGYCFQKGTRTASRSTARRPRRSSTGQPVLPATGTRTVTWTSTASRTMPRLAEREPELSRPRSSTSGRSSQRANRTRRSSSRPTSARRRTCATPRPGAAAPPRRSASKFYPFWSLSPLSGGDRAATRPCACGTSATYQPNTFKTFGKDAQYGTPDVARFAGTITSAGQA